MQKSETTILIQKRHRKKYLILSVCNFMEFKLTLKVKHVFKCILNLKHLANLSNRILQN